MPSTLVREMSVTQNVAYARTSTADQKAGIDAQVRDLVAAGVEQDHIYKEQVSSVAERAELAKCLAYVRGGDTLFITKADRLARSTAELLNTVAGLTKRGVNLVILSMGGERLDTRNPTSTLMLTILAGVATWEREIMLERQREGIAKAKGEGKYKGRAPTARSQSDKIRQLAQSGMTREAIARECGIGVASVYRALRPAPLQIQANVVPLRATG